MYYMIFWILAVNIVCAVVDMCQHFGGSYSQILKMEYTRLFQKIS